MEKKVFVYFCQVKANNGSRETWLNEAKMTVQKRTCAPFTLTLSLCPMRPMFRLGVANDIKSEPWGWSERLRENLSMLHDRKGWRTSAEMCRASSLNIFLLGTQTHLEMEREHAISFSHSLTVLPGLAST